MNKQLAAFLAAPERPANTMNYTELHGFLFAVACCPVTVEPTEWLTMIFNEEDANFASEDEAEEMLQAIAAAYNEIYDELREGDALLPECCQILTPPMANFSEESTLAAWSRGFLEGHEWLSAAWEQGIPAALDDELGSCLMMLFLFSSHELAEAFCRNSGEEQLTLEQLAAMAVENFEQAMVSYAYISASISQLLPANDPESDSE